MKRALQIFLIISVITGLLAVPSFAQEAPKSPAKSEDLPAIFHAFKTIEDVQTARTERSGDLILVDGLLLRPVGLVACGVGFVGAILVSPWAATSNSGDRVVNQLIRRPFEYTFERPLGDLDN